MRKTITQTIITLALLLTAACSPLIGTEPAPTSPNPTPRSLTILAAASLTEPFQELGNQFEADHPGVTVQFNFAGSQQLAQQLANGAPADVFASASKKYMDEVISNDRITQDAPREFARNRLVLITPIDYEKNIQSLTDLATPGLKLVLAAQEVPVGKYTLEFLDKASQNADFPATFKDDVLKNVVSYEDNVKAVLTKVLLGEADAGIVYTSDISGDAAGKVSKIEIPDELNVVAVYPVAVIKDSTNLEAAQAFIDLVRSDQGQAVLKKYGFIPLEN